MSQATIIIHPEIAAKALKMREADLYILWLVLRAMSNYQDGRGIVHVDDIRDTCVKVLGVNAKWAYDKIREGTGKYWRAPVGKKGDRTLGLIGQNNVFKHLKPEMTRSEPFVIEASVLRAEGRLNVKRIKQLLIALVAARFVDNRPVTVPQIMEHTGLSESTIRTALNECQLVAKVPNYEVVHRADSRDEAMSMKRKLSTDKSKFRVSVQNGTWVVIQQLGNTYRVPEPDRQPLRMRPRELKDFDRENASLYSKRRYHIKKSKAGEEGKYFLSVSSVGLQRATFWATRKADDVEMPVSRGGKMSRRCRVRAQMPKSA